MAGANDQHPDGRARPGRGRVVSVSISHTCQRFTKQMNARKERLLAGGPNPDSHRERKKARTRAALIEVSQRLFAEKGYAATTLDDICDDVDVRPQTLLRYFDSKAHLALAPLTDSLELLRRFLED